MEAVQEKREARRISILKAKAEKMEERQRTRRASDTKEDREKLLVFLKQMLDKEPKELTDSEKAALTILFMDPDQEYGWKKLADMFNDGVVEDISRASMHSDPSLKKEEGFRYSLRGALHKAQWEETNPLFHAFVWTTQVNTKVHTVDAAKGIDAPRERLASIALQKGVAQMLKDEKELTLRLRAKFIPNA